MFNPFIFVCFYYPCNTESLWAGGAVEYTDCICAEGQDSPPMSVPDMTRNNVMALVLESWGIWNIPPLPLFPGPLWPRVVAPDRVLPLGQIELFDI